MIPHLAIADESGSCGANVRWTLSGDVLTISGRGKMQDYTGSEGSRSPWYEKNTEIVSVIIQDGVTCIGNSAFNNCSNLTSITIPDSVTSIGNLAFYKCTSLTIITIPDSVTSIGTNAFSCCSNLTAISIPDSVTSIGNQAFSFCSSLTSISIPDSVTSIEDRAFFGCSSLTSISIPNGVKKIEDYVFFDCCNIERITIPDCVTSIGDYAFRLCSSLTNIMIPDSVTSIGKSAFGESSSLTNITIPDSVTSIGDNCFQGCSSLKAICISAESTTFGKDIFLNLDSLPIIYCYEYSDADSWAIDNGYKVEYLDKVNIDAIRSVSLGTNLRLEEERSQRLEIYIFPNHDNPAVQWKSSDPAIVSVTDGVVTGMKKGSATVTASVGSVSASINITVYTPLKSFGLNETEVWLVAKEPLQLSAIDITPIGAETAFSWISSDTTLATVNENGLVTTKKPGDVTITALDQTGISHECLLHLCYPVTGIVFEQTEINIAVGFTHLLKADVTMRTQSCVNHLVSFTSNNESIASVDENGVVTAHLLGTAVITATSSSGVMAECVVNVHEANVLTLPASIRVIEKEAFSGLEAVDIIVIPNTVEEIAEDAFSDSSITISAPAGSYAEAWAIQHGVPLI